MSSTLTATLKFNTDNWNILCKRLADLSKIGDVIKLKLTNDFLFAYSVATVTGNANKQVNAFKGTSISIHNICSDINIPNTGIDFIIPNAKNFVKQGAFFIEDKSDVTCIINYNQNNKNGKLLYLSNDILNISFVGGNSIAIKDISFDEMLAKTDSDMCEYTISVDSDKLNRVKKLAAATASESIAMWSKNGRMYFGETRWSLDVADCDTEQSKVQFNKKYLNSFEPALNINIAVFDSFIAVNQDNTCLLIGLELDEL